MAGNGMLQAAKTVRSRYQAAVERINFDVVMVCGPGGWRRSAVTAMTERVGPLLGAGDSGNSFGPWKVLGQAPNRRGNVKHHPMQKRHRPRRIGIKHDYEKSFSFGRCMMPNQRRGNVGSICGKDFGHDMIILQRR